MKRLVGLLLALASTVSLASAADFDNDGISQDVLDHTPGSYDGPQTIGAEMVVFPSLPADTWDVMFYPHWWNTGDTAYGDYDLDLSPVDHADITIHLNRNGLTSGCGFINMDFMIDGSVMGSFQILPEHGLGPIEVSMDFPPQMPPFELRYMVTNTVVSGCGSVELDESGQNTIVFSGAATPTEATTWSRIKALY